MTGDFTFPNGEGADGAPSHLRLPAPLPAPEAPGAPAATADKAALGTAPSATLPVPGAPAAPAAPNEPPASALPVPGAPPAPLGPALVPVAGAPSPTFVGARPETATPQPEPGGTPMGSAALLGRLAGATTAATARGAGQMVKDVGGAVGGTALKIGQGVVGGVGDFASNFAGAAVGDPTTLPVQTPAQAGEKTSALNPPRIGQGTAPTTSDGMGALLPTPAAPLSVRSTESPDETRAALGTSGIRPAYQGGTADGTTRLSLPTATLGGGKAELSAPAGSAGARRLAQMAGTRFAGGSSGYETDAQVAARRPDLYGPDGKPLQADAFGNAVDPKLSAQVEQMKGITASIREMNGLPPEGQGLSMPQMNSAQADAMFAQADDLTRQASGIAGQPGDRRRREQFLQQASDLRANATRLAGLSVEDAANANRTAVERERNIIARDSARVRGDPRQNFMTVKDADGGEQLIDLRALQQPGTGGATAAALPKAGPGKLRADDRAALNDISRLAKEFVGGADQIEMDPATRDRYMAITAAGQQIHMANRGTSNATMLAPSTAVQIAAGLADGSLQPKVYKPKTDKGDGRAIRVVEFNGAVWPLDPIE